MKGVIIAGTKSGVGKTTVTLGLLGILREKGLIVQAFKAGPDFIDPGLHGIISGRPSHNLDTWMIPIHENLRIFHEYSKGADISLIEGVMGLFDSAFGHKEAGSTAHLARLLGVPVVLILNCKGVGRSILPVIDGFLNFDRAVDIQALILNNVGSKRHGVSLKREILEAFPEIKVLGAIPRNNAIEIPSRHLGLFTASDMDRNKEVMHGIKKFIMDHLDIDGLIGIANVKEGPFGRPFPQKGRAGSFKVSIGVPMDQAFSFYYHDNLDALERKGAKIVTFSPIRDSFLPSGIDALYIGGGYPELYARELSGNRSMINDIQSKVKGGMPCYAECGGMMYLSKGIHTLSDYYPMVGILPFSVRMLPSMRSLGYREVELLKHTILGGPGIKARGHEFHYSERVGQVDESMVPFKTIDARGVETGDRGIIVGNCLSSYVHFHFSSNDALPWNLLESAKRKGIERA